MDSLHVATLNILNLADRWDERLPLILADMAALQPDVLGLQECVFALQQDRLIGAAGVGHYECTRGWAGRPEYGNALLVRQPLAADGVERLDLGLNRSAIRARIELSGWRDRPRGGDAPPPRDGRRGRSRRAGPAPDRLAGRRAGERRPDRGRRLQCRARRADLCPDASSRLPVGVSPRQTAPSPTSRGRRASSGPAIDTDGPPGCLDYIWVRGSIAVTVRRLVFDRPAVGDPGLYPSDHFGLAAHLVVG